MAGLPPTNASTIAAASASSVASIATKARKNGKKPSARRSRAQPRRPRRRDRRGVVGRGLARLQPRDGDERALGPHEQREHRGQQPERGVAADRVPAAVGADAERDRQQRLGQVVAEAVEVDADRRVLLAPAGELAVGAVEQDLELDQQHRRDRGAARPGRVSTAAAAPRPRSSPR